MITTLHRIADEIPAPVAVAAGITVPWWKEWLSILSEGLSLAAQVIAIALALYKLWDAYTQTKGRADATMGVANAMGVAAKKGSVASGSIIAIVAAFLGVFAVGSWLASKAHADPLTPAASSSSKSGRKRTKDDAGEDETDGEALKIEGAPKWFDEAMKLRGTEEKIGRRNNPKVLAMFADAGHPEIKSTDTPWCAAYVGAVLERCGIRCTKALTARSYLKWGVELDDPRPGCIVVMWRGPRNDGFTGHIGFFVREEGEFIWMLGGNQGDAITVAKFRKSKILSYRWPRSLAKSGTMQGAIAAKLGAIGGGATLAGEAATLPDVPAPKTVVTEHAAEAVSKVGGSLEAVRDAVPTGTKLALYIGIACCVLTIIGTSLVIYNRWNIRDETGR